ncbi:MAG: S24 family peptidase [Rhodocyclaceae bacterium]|jgi:SOS-response transcriptional repressor LexA|uniref:S24 family peptidase n=1 Tax=Sulfuricystis thermophila TaxID=2496847 RepID=UPI00103597C2|nr:S24 family peptidase [Sulfuricystis thermophila]MDI6748622.1 S24 family peptidase [Rhodocyclaceae bacterium]
MNEFPTPKKPFPIPVVPAGESAPDAALDHCSAAEPFALMVLGDSMEPEFVEGEIIIVEPEGLATAGSFVMAWLDGEWIFRQLVGGPGDWKLRPLNPKYPTASIPDLSVIKGVIIQKSKPGRRKAAKRYVD